MLGMRLQRARKAAGLSLRDLAAKVGLTHTAIRKYEEEKLVPSSTLLLSLAGALGVRTEYFFRPLTVELERIDYRKHRDFPKRRLEAIEYALLDQIERRLELESFFPKPPGRAFVPIGSLPEQIGDLAQIEEAADAVREAWDIGSDPIPDLIDLLEQQGIRVFRIAVEDRDCEFDGLAASTGKVPLIVVASHWPGDRQRFTLAHELGHLMIVGRLTPGIDEERACNRFAGAFLAPRAALLRKLGGHRSSIEPKELALLKEEFGLSMASLLHRTHEVGIVSQTWRISQSEEFRRKGWHRTEPGLPYPAEKARVFEEHVFHALAEGYVGESKAAELLRIPVAELRAMRSLELHTPE